MFLPTVRRCSFRRRHWKNCDDQTQGDPIVVDARPCDCCRLRRHFKATPKPPAISRAKIPVILRQYSKKYNSAGDKTTEGEKEQGTDQTKTPAAGVVVKGEGEGGADKRGDARGKENNNGKRKRYSANQTSTDGRETSGAGSVESESVEGRIGDSAAGNVDEGETAKEKPRETDRERLLYREADDDEEDAALLSDMEEENVGETDGSGHNGRR